MRVRELRVSYLPRGDVTWDNRSPLRAPLDAAALVTRILKNEAVEVFCILCLNTKQRLLGFHEVSRGMLDSTIAHPREVFKAAILANAAAVIVAHNHPSGDAAPSPNDLVLTTRLVSAGEILGIEVIDHIIVGGDGSFYSFKEGGQL